jgi:transposase-like protein
MRAYSTDLKERLVRAVTEGQPMREAARRFGVAVTTVKRAVVQQRETGSLERKPILGRPRAIRSEHDAALRARLEAAPRCDGAAHRARGMNSGSDLGKDAPYPSGLLGADRLSPIPRVRWRPDPHA